MQSLLFDCVVGLQSESDAYPGLSGSMDHPQIWSATDRHLPGPAEHLSYTY